MLHERAGWGAIAVARAVVFGVWFVLVATTPLHLLAAFPDAMFEPVGLLALFPTGFWDVFITPGVLTVFRVGLAAHLLLVASGIRRSRPLTIVAALGILLFDGVLKSHGGFINHGRFALLYTAILLSLTEPLSETKPSGQREESRQRPDPGSVLRLAALVIGFAYALIGIHRLLVGGPGIFVDDSLATYIMLRTFEPARYTFELGYAAVGSTALVAVMKAGFFVTTVAEIASPFAVFHHRLRLAWLAVIIPFHISTLLTMNIFFWENLILIGLLFTELPTRIEARRQVDEPAVASIQQEDPEPVRLSIARSQP